MVAGATLGLAEAGDSGGSTRSTFTGSLCCIGAVAIGAAASGAVGWVVAGALAIGSAFGATACGAAGIGAACGALRR